MHSLKVPENFSSHTCRGIGEVQQPLRQHAPREEGKDSNNALVGGAVVWEAKGQHHDEDPCHDEHHQGYRYGQVSPVYSEMISEMILKHR